MYLHWNEKTITDFSDANIANLYDQGYVFTRIGKGVMHQTRSLRIDLSRFELSSENRRILKKIEDISFRTVAISLPDYTWEIGKLAKDFYDMKFGPDIMSAQKIKEMLTLTDKSNFNTLLTYAQAGKDIGYAICYESDSMLHYSYPFYDLNNSPKDIGMGMMTRAILHAKDKGLKYIYLGSLQRPGDTYKLQFSGLEWFDGTIWAQDVDKAATLLKKGSM
jgi:arginyl-tRNA--protein-N-Asp/Glu arginylyltransferase